VAEALKKETNLQGYRALGELLQQLTGHSAEGKLDKRELLEWYEQNRERLKKDDVDVTPSPTVAPTPDGTPVAPIK
jgi:hypothetical protein